MKRHKNTDTRGVKRRRGRKFLTLFILAALAFYLAGTYFAVPGQAFVGGSSLEASLVSDGDSTQSKLAWPAYGQAALGTKATGLIVSHGDVESAPIASIAKLMTALAVLEKHPLSPGEQGPTITITQADQEKYDWFYMRGGSLAAIKVGEKISQYKAMEAMLLPSANNFAYTLARWSFGSLKDYTDFANNYALQLGLESSHFSDASGFSPQTKSNAEDLIKIAQAALQNPVLAGIVQKEKATVPVAGKVYNTNLLLLRDHTFIGLKTGNTDQAGNCLVFAATHKVGGEKVTVIGVLMGAKKRSQLFNDSLKLMNSAKQNIHTKTIVKQGQVVGHYDLPWGESADVIASSALTDVVWSGNKIVPELDMQKISYSAKAGQAVGSITSESINSSGSKSIQIELASDIDPPSWQWRLSHPGKTWQLAF